jgi:glycosyltransferase involved in cell wall biosynthesis
MNALRLCFVGPASNVTTRRWVEWFVARGHDVTVITVEPAEAATFRQIDVSTPAGPRKLGRLLSAARLALTVHRLKPDVVHVHYARGLAWGLLLARFHPYVVFPWGSDVLEEQGAFREWYGRWLTCALLRRAALISVPSEYLERRVRELLPSVSRLARIAPGVDLQRFRSGLDVRSLREWLGIGEGARVIFSPRLAQPFYQHDRIIRALPAVREKVTEAVLVVPEHFADREYVAGLRRLAEKLGVADRVRFVGDIPYSDMPLWYNLADAVVMVPKSDGLPNSLVEAMACGAVPVLNRLPQYAELVNHGENGFLVGPEEGDLVGALVGALSDPAVKERIARANRAKVVATADQDQEMSRMEDWYFRLAGPDRRKASAGERWDVV